VKPFLPPIVNDVTMFGDINKEKVILCSHHLDLIYYQSNTLYDIIMHAPRSSMDPSKHTSGPHVNGMVNYMSHVSIG
jgi:hypothetical protein